MRRLFSGAMAALFSEFFLEKPSNFSLMFLQALGCSVFQVLVSHFSRTGYHRLTFAASVISISEKDGLSYKLHFSLHFYM